MGAAVVCAAAGTTLVLLSLGGFGGMFDALSLVGASMAFAAAAIFLIISILRRRRSRQQAAAYPPLASQQPDDPAD